MRVRFAPSALADYDELFEWIADRAGIATARRYGGRLRSYCEGFAQFPERGMCRDDIRPGLRLIGFERRITIAFAVIDAEVVILRLLYGGRDFEALLGDEEEPH